MDIEVKPVGKVVEVEGIKYYIDAMLKKWNEIKGPTAWWKVWTRSTYFVVVTKFLLNCLDDLIAYVDNVVDNGPDKKATVLNAMNLLYDYIVREAIPIWMRPFSGVVKDYIINTMISTSIDWIIEKYRHGEWRRKDELNMQMFERPDFRPRV